MNWLLRAVGILGIAGSFVAFAPTADAQTYQHAGARDARQSSFISSYRQAGPSPSTGAFLYDIPLAVPPGRNGMQPSLSLAYNSHARDRASLVGFGWELAIPSITLLNLSGVDGLYATTTFVSSMSGELRATSTVGQYGDYAARIETGDLISYTFSSTTNAWTASDLKGTTYIFGTATTSRQDDASDTSRMYSWMLSSTTDANGNNVRYEYFKDQGAIYPSKIIYTNYGGIDGIFEMKFSYETRTDTPTMYHPAFFL